MTTKLVGITAIVATFLVLAMGGHSVSVNVAKADQCWKRGDNVNDQPGWNPCSYTQHPQTQQISWDPSHGDCGQRGFSWEYCGYEQHQPQIQQLGFFPASCFWSYPVQCQSS